MPGQAQEPRRITPLGLSDATDGTDVFAGACAQLANLIPQPNARGKWIPRPAMTPDAAIPNWATATSALVTVGNVAYGMAGSTVFPGKDAPFVYSDGNFLPISGLAPGVLPASQLTTGDWTPPTISQVAGRVVFTHPGFAAGTTYPLTYILFEAVLTSGQNTLSGPNFLYSENVVGFTIHDSLSFIPPLTTISSITPLTIYTTGTGVSGTNTITLASAAGVVVGQQIYFAGGQSIISSLVGNVVGLPNSLPQNFSGADVVILGSTVTMSAAATGSATALIEIDSPLPAIKFGWLDLGGFTTNIVANASAGILTGSFSLVGIQPGMLVTGPGFPANTQVVDIANLNFTVFGQTNLNSQVLQLGAYPVGPNATIQPGQFISGPNIPANTFVIGYNPANYQLTMSNSATATAIGQNFTVSGQLIRTSHGASFSTTQGAFTISGGSPSAPLWGAGDTALNPLAGTDPAVFVNSLAGRAYYGVNTPTTAGVQASDAGAACVRTFETQALTFNDSTPVLGAAQLDLATLTGGMSQSLIVFQSDEVMNQITGDFLTGISVNVLPAPGTLAPLTIASCPRGLLYMASDGLRLMTHSAEVSDPLGAYGEGITLPMSNALTPTRASASFNENVYRLTVTWQPPQSAANVWGSVPRTDEFWFHLAPLGRQLHESRWSGPHSSTLAFSAPSPSLSSFICVPLAAPSQLYQADVRPLSGSTYVELGAQLSCVLQTLLLPDNQRQNAVEVIETTMWIGYQSGQGEILVTATDDMGQTLDKTYVWLGPFSLPAQRPIAWHKPLVFRQMRLQVQAGAIPQLQFGAMAIRDEMLNYQLPYPVPAEFVLGTSVLGGSGVLGP